MRAGDGDGTVGEDTNSANGGGVSVEDIDALTVRVEVSGLDGMIGRIKETKQRYEETETPTKIKFKKRPPPKKN